jgi:hypothetical protein
MSNPALTEADEAIALAHAAVMAAHNVAIDRDGIATTVASLNARLDPLIANASHYGAALRKGFDYRLKHVTIPLDHLADLALQLAIDAEGGTPADHSPTAAAARFFAQPRPSFSQDPD